MSSDQCCIIAVPAFDPFSNHIQKKKMYMSWLGHYCNYSLQLAAS